MSGNADVDELFDIKNAFYLGNYQQCVNESQKMKPSTPELKLENEIFMYRAYVALKRFGIVLDGISSGDDSQLQDIRRLAEYLSDTSKREKIVNYLDKQMTASLDSSNSIFPITAATVYIHEDNNDSALRILHGSDSLECQALSIQILLRQHRVDLARKELQRLQQVDEDATVTQLALALVNLALGGDKLQEAFYIYQEMADKYGGSSMLLNGQAACLMAQCKWEDAEPVLQEAMDKDNNDPQTLVNLVILSQHIGKAPEVSNRYVSQLKDSHRNHPWVKELLTKEEEFDRLAMNFAPSVQS